MSEHASWSSRYYGRIVAAALAAAGAPPDLVQIVTGYADAGEALVTGGVDKLIFVGSTEVRPGPLAFSSWLVVTQILQQRPGMEGTTRQCYASLCSTTSSTNVSSAVGVGVTDTSLACGSTASPACCWSR